MVEKLVDLLAVKKAAKTATKTVGDSESSSEDFLAEMKEWMTAD